MEANYRQKNLFDEAFPGLTTAIARAKQVGYPWVSTPFIKEIQGNPVSHVGLLDYPVFINGKKHLMGALHAICTKATHQGKGFATACIQEAIAWAKDRYECLLLFTEIPKFYEKLSYKPIQEHRFHLQIQRPKGHYELISLVTPQDDALFVRCFRERSSPSDHFWMQDNGQIASFNTLFATYPTFWSLYYSPIFDGILSFKIQDKTLHLFDVIARKLPSLDLILAHLPSVIEEIYFYFSPDLFTTTATCKPLLCDNSMVDFSGYLMAYGPFPDTLPFTIPPLSRC